jgi:hypothetical protein
MKGGNMRANLYIYKTAVEGACESKVVLDDEGDCGLYNRSNRSLHHFVENGFPLLLLFPLCSYVYPVPTFIYGCIYMVGKIAYTIGYTKKGFGGHFPGFALERLSMVTLNGLAFIVTIKAF